VPRVNDPSESVVRRFTGAMRVTTLVKGAYDLVEMSSIHHILPRHEDPVPCFQEVALWVDFAELAYLPKGETGTELSEDIPLWEETIEEAPMADNGSDMFPSSGHAVDIESAGPDSVVFASPILSRVVILVVSLAALAVLCSLSRAPVPADAYNLEGALEKSDSSPSPSPSPDCGPSVDDEIAALVEVLRRLEELRDCYDSLLGSPGGDSGLPREEEVDMDSTRLGRQRETGVTPESEPRSIEGRTIIPGWTAMPGGLGEATCPTQSRL
jgi:hypothetical protein